MTSVQAKSRYRTSLAIHVLVAAQDAVNVAGRYDDGMGGVQEPTSASPTPAGICTQSTALKLRKKGSRASGPEAATESAGHCHGSLSTSVPQPGLPSSLVPAGALATRLKHAAPPVIDESPLLPIAAHVCALSRAASRAAKSPRFICTSHF